MAADELIEEGSETFREKLERLDSELQKQEFVRNVRSLQQFKAELDKSGLELKGGMNVPTLYDLVRSEPSITLTQDEDGGLHAEEGGDNIRLSTAIHKFSNTHSQLFKKSYAEISKAVRSKADFQSDEQKSQYIAMHGYTAFAELPLKYEPEPSLDTMSREQYLRLPMARRAQIVSEIHQDGINVILSRRTPTDSPETEAKKVFGTRLKCGAVIYDQPEQK